MEKITNPNNNRITTMTMIMGKTNNYKRAKIMNRMKTALMKVESAIHILNNTKYYLIILYFQNYGKASKQHKR